jgi:hypothetical protein
LTQYQRIIGGTKGYLKGKGVIKFEDTAPGKFSLFFISA